MNPRTEMARYTSSRPHTMIRDADGRWHRFFRYPGAKGFAAILGSPTEPDSHVWLDMTPAELLGLAERGDLVTGIPVEESEARQAKTCKSLASGGLAPCFAPVAAIEAAHALHLDLAREGITDHTGFANAVLRRRGERRVEHLRVLRLAEMNEVRRALSMPRAYEVRLGDFSKTSRRSGTRRTTGGQSTTTAPRTRRSGTPTAAAC